MLATKKQPAPTLTERIRQAADKIRAADADAKTVIELWLDEQKASRDGGGLPRETHHQMLISRWKQPWFAVLGLEEERAHEQ
jgi:hypothetical protein